MLTAIRKRMTYANVALTLALVFAMTGGAYAAKKYLITSTKQIKPSVLAQLKGKAGPAGAQGVQGPKGETGPAGANGKDGTNGTNGTSGTDGKEGATGPAGPTGPKGATGAAGSPWTAGGTLPEGQTETGTWSVANVAKLAEAASTYGSDALGPISFTIPIANELGANHTRVNDKASGAGDLTSGSATVEKVTTGLFIKEAPISGQGIPAGTTIQAVNDKWNSTPGEEKWETTLTLSANATETNAGVTLTQGVFPECENASHAGAASVSNPEAQPGYLCVYTGFIGGQAQVLAVTKPTSPLAVPGAGVSGAFVFVFFHTASPPPPFAAGSWAVTAE